VSSFGRTRDGWRVTLEVVEVLPLLGDLEPAELEMVRQREASGRAHPWILARVDALLEAEADADTTTTTLAWLEPLTPPSSAPEC